MYVTHKINRNICTTVEHNFTAVLLISQWEPQSLPNMLKYSCIIRLRPVDNNQDVALSVFVYCWGASETCTVLCCVIPRDEQQSLYMWIPSKSGSMFATYHIILWSYSLNIGWKLTYFRGTMYCGHMVGQSCSGICVTKQFPNSIHMQCPKTKPNSWSQWKAKYCPSKTRWTTWSNLIIIAIYNSSHAIESHLR